MVYVVTDGDDRRRTLVSIHVAPATRLAMRSVETADLRTAGGIVGDRYEHARHRHVSLQSAEDLDASSLALGAVIDPGTTRRNLTVSGLSLPTTPGIRIALGDAVELEVVRVAAPCRIMDDAVGPGAHRAMRHRGGVICRVVRGGHIATGDRVLVGVAGDEPHR